MDDLKSRYEKKFNSVLSKVKLNEFWDRYYKNGEDFFYKRLVFSVQFLYGNVLDVGSADGFGAQIMIKNNSRIKNITCMDISDKAIAMSKKNLSEINNIKIIRGIAEEIPFPSSSFDSIHCGATLEHVFDDKKSISEIFRVTRDIAVMTVPLGGGLSFEHIREYKHAKNFRAIINPYFIIIKGRIFEREGDKKSLVLVCRKKLL